MMNGDLAEARGSIYHFLSLVFLEKPRRELVEKILENRTIDDLSGIFDEGGLSHLRKFAEEYTGDIASLEVEYTALLVAPLGRYVTPYESVYRGRREVDGKKAPGLLMGQPALEVKRTIREIGAEIDGSARWLPDHIGLELQVMQFLCGKEAKAWAAGENELALRYVRFEEEFVREHLSSWVPALTERIMENTGSEFFKGIACMTRAFIELETSAIHLILLDEPLGSEISDTIGQRI